LAAVVVLVVLLVVVRLVEQLQILFMGGCNQFQILVLVEAQLAMELALLLVVYSAAMRELVVEARMELAPYTVVVL
jgi:hypothetical protein